MYVFQNVSGVTPPNPFGAVTQNRAPPLQNPGCVPAVESPKLVLFEMLRRLRRFNSDTGFSFK